MTDLLTVGLSYRMAPLPLRERVAFLQADVREALADLREQLRGIVTESAILSTCHRTEIYSVTDAAVSAQVAKTAVVSWLQRYRHLPERESLDAYLYTFPGREAVSHAFRLASGLDSMVLGEPQVLGQMKEAARIAQEMGALGAGLHQLFQQSFSTAKEVRSQTRIGWEGVTLASAAVSLAKRIFEDLQQVQVLVIGAGGMAHLVARQFCAQRPRRIVVANRTEQRGRQLAGQIGAETALLKDLPLYISQFDVIISATASALPVIGLGMVERAVSARCHRPIFMVDLAVPHDIEPEVSRLNDVFRYTVDDLGRVAALGQESRQAAVVQAEAMINERVSAFVQAQRVRRVAPAIHAVRTRAQALRGKEVVRAQLALARGADMRSVLESLSSTLTNKLLHGMTLLLRDAAGSGEVSQSLVDSLLPESQEDLSAR